MNYNLPVSLYECETWSHILREGRKMRIRVVGHVALIGERRGVCRFLVWKTEGKRPLWRPRRRRENNIYMNLQEHVCGGMGWIELAKGMDSCGHL
jgi:hypothetical protein